MARDYRALNARGLYLAGANRYRIPAVYLAADMLAIPAVAAALPSHTRLPKGGCIVFLRGLTTLAEQQTASRYTQIAYEATYRRRLAEQGYFSGCYPIARRLVLGTMSHA